MLITLGYAQSAKVGPLASCWVFLSSYPDLLAAAVGFGLLIMAGITSIRIARRRIKYETWWVVHLYMYLALALAFAHQIVTGGSFVGHPLTRAIWILVWASTAGMVIVFRVLQPSARSLSTNSGRLRPRRGAGSDLDGLFGSAPRSPCRLWGSVLPVAIPDEGFWCHAHPYSLSALPRPPYIRVTVKGLGDQSRAVAGSNRALESPSRDPTEPSPITPGPPIGSC